jgi:hypothetical protein
VAVLTQEAILNAIGWLQQALLGLEPAVGSEAPSVGYSPSEPTSSEVPATVRIAWGSKVSPEFKKRVLWIADQLGCNASDLMACMAWEDAETFKSDTKNAAGSGAVGLIQFMPKTAVGLGTTTTALAAMSPEDQLRYVYEYFKPYTGRLHNLGDVYMAILWPKGVGQPDSYVLFDRAKTPTTFRQNAGLDVDHNGAVTRAECLVKINQKLVKGMQPGYIG